MKPVIQQNRWSHEHGVTPCPSWEPTVPVFPPSRAPVATSDEQRILSSRELDVFYSFDRVTTYRLPPALRFSLLAFQWKRDNLFESSPWRMAMHPAYQCIIGMGWQAVPFILEQLSCEADFWFEALLAITEEQPVPPKHAGDIQAMRQDWLRWGREHGYDC